MYNQRGYTHYVVVTGPAERKQKGCIESGWEYVEDAKEQAASLRTYAGMQGGRVLTRVGAKRQGIVPSDDRNWCNPRKM